MVDSGTDASFSSLDHVTASRGLHELRQHYLDTIAKIRHDVLDHVNQTKISASKKIRYITVVYKVKIRFTASEFTGLVLSIKPGSRRSSGGKSVANHRV